LPEFETAVFGIILDELHQLLVIPNVSGCDEALALLISLIQHCSDLFSPEIAFVLLDSHCSLGVEDFFYILMFHIDIIPLICLSIHNVFPDELQCRLMALVKASDSVLYDFESLIIPLLCLVVLLEKLACLVEILIGVVSQLTGHDVSEGSVKILLSLECDLILFDEVLYLVALLLLVLESHFILLFVGWSLSCFRLLDFVVYVLVVHCVIKHVNVVEFFVRALFEFFFDYVNALGHPLVSLIVNLVVLISDHALFFLALLGGKVVVGLIVQAFDDVFSNFIDIRHLCFKFFLGQVLDMVPLLLRDLHVFDWQHQRAHLDP
jgi:hypothetical protein